MQLPLPMNICYADEPLPLHQLEHPQCFSVTAPFPSQKTKQKQDHSFRVIVSFNFPFGTKK
jgi:hypothetical protein